MAKCKARRCKCNSSRIVSNGAKNCSCRNMDVCSTPFCGTPNTLSLLAPVIYDEIGINLCATFELGTDISATYPTAQSISMTVIDIGLTYGTADGEVAIESIAGRPNCYDVTLSNLEVTFAARIYDCANRLLDTIPVTATYLPSDVDAPTYDEDTNPESVELEIYAPYGPAYESGGDLTPILNVIGFADTNNSVRQGLNLMAIPAVLDFDTEEDTVTVGLSVFLQCLYNSAYLVPTEGRSYTPKGSIIPGDDSLCMNFVEGSLLDMCIRPLALGGEDGEEQYKQELNQNNSCCCALSTPNEQAPPAEN